MIRHHRIAALFSALLLGACGSGAGDGMVAVAIVGDAEAMFSSSLRLSVGAQHLRGATAEGLVKLDENGEVVPGLAERWIVTDDGMSYIFRLRNTQWPDGSALTGQSVRDRLARLQSELRGTSLGLDLAQVREIRAMTGRVVEFRLSSPMPDFLQLLAQPELGLRQGTNGAGPMTYVREGDSAILTVIPPAQRNLPEVPAWQDDTRVVSVSAMSGDDAARAFDEGRVDVVLNGRLATLPLADTGPLSRGTVRLDAATGMFGLLARTDSGILGDRARREAIAMALDREALIEPFNIGGWMPTTRVVAPGLAGDTGSILERWADTTLEARRSEASRRVAAWEADAGKEASVRIALPEGPGSDILFNGLSRQLASVGIEANRVGMEEATDLVLIDALARYGSARWYLNQFNCSLRRGLCSPEADALVEQAMETTDPAEKAELLAEAEAEMTRANVFIPIGAPIRWSLVRGGVEGFAENRWGLHPLFPLSRAPI